MQTPEAFIENILAHEYDPAKRREYYLRNRKLKGRRAGVVDTTGSRRSTGSSPSSSTGHARPTTWKSHKAQVAALEARLDSLKRVLAQLVKEAKARSGVAPADNKTPGSSTTKSSSSKAGGGNDKPRTAEQKRKDAERQKEYREKQKPELEQLRQQIKDVQTKIQAALEEARKKEAARKQTLAVRNKRTVSNSKPKTATKGR